MSDKLRVGIVGQRGLAFVAGLRAQPRVELVALCDRQAELAAEQARRYAIPRSCARFQELLELVDAVIVATPMQLHVPQTILALQAGKHVLSEVTAAVSIEECWRLLDAARVSGATYMLAENYCYLPANVLVRELARQGLFGTLYYGEGAYIHEVRDYHHTADGQPTWRYFWQVGVNGNTYGTHSLGPVMQWFTAVDPQERIASVVCLGSGQHTDPEHPHDDTSLMLCKLRSGKLIQVRLDMLSNRPHLATYYALQGTHGAYEAARVEGEPGRIWLGESTPGAQRHWRDLNDYASALPPLWRDPPRAAREAGHGGGDYFMIADWVAAIVEGSPPAIDVYTALEWTAAGLCSQLSIANGGVPIQVPDFRDSRQRPVLLDAPPVEV